MSSSDDISITLVNSIPEDKHTSLLTKNNKDEDNNSPRKNEYNNSPIKDEDNNSRRKEEEEDSIFTIQSNLPTIVNPNSLKLHSQDGGKVERFKDNDDEFIKILRSLEELSDLQIRTIEVRYLNVLSEYRKRIKIYDFLYHFTRLFISLGGVAVPALLSIQSPGQVSSIGLYWFTWVVSLAVTITHNITNIFRFDKKYQGIHTTIEKLYSEGWCYLELSGRYVSHHTNQISTHVNQYTHFVNTIEKIKNKQNESEYNAPTEEKLKQGLKPSTGVGSTSTGTSATATLSEVKN